MRRPVAVQAFEIGETDARAVRHALRAAIGETRAQPGLLERAQIGLGIIEAADVVAPVVHEGDAGIDRLGGREPRALIHVARLRISGRAPPWCGNSRTPAFSPDMLRNSEFHMCQWVSTRPGSTIMPAPLIVARARRVELGSDRDDGAVAHMHVAVGDVAGVALHGHDVGVADDEVAARGQSRRPARRWPCGAGLGAANAAPGRRERDLSAHRPAQNVLRRLRSDGRHASSCCRVSALLTSAPNSRVPRPRAREHGAASLVSGRSGLTTNSITS